MAEQKKEKRKFTKKLLHKYRMVVLNEDTFEERFSFRLTRLNVFVAAGLSAILLIALTTVLIAFTPLREYIPGYSSPELKERAAALAYKTDSLQNVIRVNDQYLHSIKSALTGEFDPGSLSRDSIPNDGRMEVEYEDVAPSRADSILRNQVAQEDKYNILPTATENLNFSLVAPVKGTISETYNIKEKHYAVDVVVTKNLPVKSVADGRVIFAEWTAETGYVMIIEHSYGLISVYKHNASLTKSQGEVVRAGEVIATAGSTGEFSTGPHLHFELWNEGNPVDPTEYIDFN
ncbi:MAG: M23 family metallopeptidase [Bacteroidota bacterium]|uniref:Membrane proteins related to metalloendopeptidases n=1 Tax=Christiangramia flava JLT2011 TaxID=1229726 RepID=A0A1L7I392_9FLAO|nr:M23 family metallopeptidase [Christiangramia flava]APU68088.1 Membrane proteins related to metalloendopeptidases [Christiangramia flava JLT2011]MAM17701.1 M23 family peptidase [Christiangramia sp.]MEE2771457.1 M23 family metallopeptidase [Bacteroidota bacterium]OSS40590.1 Lipoprotein NlpD precursor [Christiangramia flava JLT2011]